MRAERLRDNPILRVDTANPGIGDNVNGPSLVRVPDWVPNRLGRYYLYFAHHRDRFIRLAWADAVEGPWQVHAPGTLQRGESACLDHIASPDVFVDEGARQIRLYYHGVVHHPESEPDPHANAIDLTRPFVQRTFCALSRDGLHFETGREPCGPSYFRVVRLPDAFYALAMPGLLYRSEDGLTGWQRGPQVLPDETRHHALLPREGCLHVFFTRAGDCPERILHTRLPTTGDWTTWKTEGESLVLEPEEPWEGADLPLRPSQRGQVMEPVRQLRDPCVFQDEGRLYLVYAVAGEQGLAIARLHGVA
jgi:hypothetical protein